LRLPELTAATAEDEVSGVAALAAPSSRGDRRPDGCCGWCDVGALTSSTE